MKSDDKCVLCNGIIKTSYVPMKQWKIEGNICSECYSKKISEYLKNNSLEGLIFI